MSETPTPPAPPANAQEARTRLDTLIADKNWGAKVLAGDAGANRDYQSLLNMADNADPSTIAAAMSGDIGEMPDSSVKLMSETAGMLREIGIREEIIEQTLKGHEVSSEEYKLVEAYKARQMKDPVFVNAFLSGDPEARQKMNAHFDHSFGRHQRRTAGRQAVVRVAYGTATAVTSTSWGYRQ